MMQPVLGPRSGPLFPVRSGLFVGQRIGRALFAITRIIVMNIMDGYGL